MPVQHPQMAPGQQQLLPPGYVMGHPHQQQVPVQGAYAVSGEPVPHQAQPGVVYQEVHGESAGNVYEMPSASGAAAPAPE